MDCLWRNDLLVCLLKLRILWPAPLVCWEFRAPVKEKVTNQFVVDEINYWTTTKKREKKSFRNVMMMMKRRKICRVGRAGRKKIITFFCDFINKYQGLYVIFKSKHNNFCHLTASTRKYRMSRQQPGDAPTEETRLKSENGNQLIVASGPEKVICRCWWAGVNTIYRKKEKTD